MSAGSVAASYLASPASASLSGVKIVGLVIGLVLIYAAIRAMFGKRK
jgi:hypothetical protein